MESILTFLLALFQLWVTADQPQLEPVVQSEGVEIATVISVTDGDTITVDLNGVREKVRYIGIDTPEPYRDGEPACYSKEASARNAELVAGQQVELVADKEDRDRFDRLLRYVYIDEIFVNEVLVVEGYATTLKIKPNTQFAQIFSDAKNEARSNKVGLWEVCDK
jgi:micrococcal nuclease